jgi:hypothetical protein
MIRVYYLETEKIDNTEYCKGQQYIHRAILEVEGTLRKLLQDTTDGEHNGLIKVADSWREANQDEIAGLTKFKADFPDIPARDIFKEVDDLKASLTKAQTDITALQKKVVAK